MHLSEMIRFPEFLPASVLTYWHHTRTAIDLWPICVGGQRQGEIYFRTQPFTICMKFLRQGMGFLIDPDNSSVVRCTGNLLGNYPCARIRRYSSFGEVSSQAFRDLFADPHIFFKICFFGHLGHLDLCLLASWHYRPRLLQLSIGSGSRTS